MAQSWSMYLLVALGGAVGASLRFGVYQLVLNLLGKGFPYATLVVNIVGSFVMGWLYGLIQQGQIEVEFYRTLIGVGLLGAFTTFSTFSLDTLLLIQAGDIAKAILNVLMNVTLCIVAAALGLYMMTNK